MTRILGLGANLVAGVVVLTNFAPILGVLSEKDPLYFLISRGSQPNPFKFLIRFIPSFIYIHGVIRTAWFLILYYGITFQAYIHTLIMITNLPPSWRRLQHFTKLRLFHARITLFTDAVTGWLMFMGHTAGVTLLWTVFRGWGQLPLVIYVFFPTFSIIGFVWIAGMLTVMGYISNVSSSTISSIRRNSMSKIVLRQVKVVRGIYFKSGSRFTIRSASAGEFTTRLVDNLTAVIIAF